MKEGCVLCKAFDSPVGGPQIHDKVDEPEYFSTFSVTVIGDKLAMYVSLGDINLMFELVPVGGKLHAY